VQRLEDGALHLVASYGDMSAAASVPLDRGVVSGRAALDGETVHVHDITAAETESREPLTKFVSPIAVVRHFRQTVVSKALETLNACFGRRNASEV
jgi:hypothetical protein